MYIAELRGKLSRDNENKEDILTSNVFSFFKYADRQVYLLPLLRNLVSDISPVDAQNAEFHFWPLYDEGTEPDVVIIAGSYYFLIEAKYYSGFGQATEKVEHQLVREVKHGRYAAHNLEKIFKLVVITSQYSFSPSLYKEVPMDARDDFIWINWQRITLLLEKSLGSETLLPPETRLFADDLHALLVRKNLRMFAGKEFLVDQPTVRPIEGELFFDAQTAEYRGDFFGFLKTLKTELELIQFPEMIFYSYPAGQGRNQTRKKVSKGSSTFKDNLFRKRFEGMDSDPLIPGADNIFFREGKHGKG